MNRYILFYVSGKKTVPEAGTVANFNPIVTIENNPHGLKLEQSNPEG